MTMISDLPRKLENEILSRVPLKSMRAVRLTCTKWNTLSKSRSFSEMQIGKVAATREGESTMIVMMDHNLYLVSVVVNGDPSMEAKGKLICLNDQVKISQVFHCEGLLLCILKENTKVVVWNPYTGQTRWIEPRYSHRGQNGWFLDRYRYAIGYVNKNNTSCRSHKILRFMDDRVRPPGSFRALGTRFSWYEIYDFDSDLWTTLDVPSDWYITFYQSGLSLKGNTYFCATKSNSEDELDNHIICFDFTSERFGPLMLLPFSAGHHDYVTLSCVREEKLAVLLTHNEINPYEIDIWITTKIETEEVTWSKFLTLNTKPDYPISTGGFFIDEEKKVAMGFDEERFNHHTLSIVGEAGYLRKLDFGERADKIRRSTHMCSYVPSSVQIKQSAEGKRKQQSDLENGKYDEHMLKLVALENGVKE